MKALWALAAGGIFLYALRLWLTPIKSWDFWFHIKTGEWIVANRFVPSGDLFSAGHAGREWIVNAWLSEALLWAGYHLGGSVAVLLGVVILATASFSLIAFFAWRISGRGTLSLLTVLLAITISYLRFAPRPELFTTLAMVLLLGTLYQYKFRIADRLFWLIPLGCLWANLHMGFTASAGVLGCFLAGESAAAALCASKKKPIPDGVIAGPRLKKLALVALAMIAATLVNPYGPKAWLFMTKLSGQFGLIGEWSPLLGGRIELSPVIVSMALLSAVTFGALALSRRPQDLTGLLLAGLFAGAALKFYRQAAQFSLVAPFVIAAAARGPRFPDFPAKWAKKLSPSGRAYAGVGGLMALVIAFGLSLVVFGRPELAARSPFGFGEDRARFSPRAIDFLRHSGLVGGKLFNSMESGGWLIWNLFPEQKVLIDGRIDMYGAEAHLDYLRTASGPDLGDRLREKGFDYCYLPFPQGLESAAQSAAFALIDHPDWALVYFDDSALIYARREPRNEALIGRDEYQLLNPLKVMTARGLDSARHPDRVRLEAERTRRECPDSAWANVASGLALEEIGRPREAVARLEMARRNQKHWGPELNAGLEFYLGRASFAAGENDAAIRHLKDAIRLIGDGEEARPNQAKFRILLAQCYVATRDEESALSQLELAALADPPQTLNSLDIREFDSLRANPRFPKIAQP